MLFRPTRQYHANDRIVADLKNEFAGRKNGELRPRYLRGEPDVLPGIPEEMEATTGD